MGDMNTQHLTKERVIEAFGGGASGVTKAAESFGITRFAIYMWTNDKQIPDARILALVLRGSEYVDRVNELVKAERKKAA